MNEISNDVVIWKDDPGMTCTYIFKLNMGGEIESIPWDAFKWNEPPDEAADWSGGYLTLAEVRDQLIVRFGRLPGVIYVWVESPMSCEIYQCGNLIGSNSWTKYGTTCGYA